MADLPPPDLSTREAQAAYRQELFRIARPWRVIGLIFCIVGILMMYYAQGWHTVVERTLGLAGIILVAIGCSLMIAGIIKRTLYHKKRMRGL
jgi:uncharacterized protein YjeT (DUF2065 family)